MDTIFMKSESSKTSEPHVLILKLNDKLDVGYRDTERVFKVFDIKNLGEYHDLYVQSDTLLIANVFGNFRNKCTKYINLIMLIFYLHQD